MKYCIVVYFLTFATLNFGMLKFVAKNSYENKAGIKP